MDLLVAVVALALGFAWTNGFHDAANAVATSLTTGALTPRIALLTAALLNAYGALMGVEIVRTVGADLLDVPVSGPGLGLVLWALVAAIGWNLLTWWLGLPSSSSHALIGGLAGAGLAVGARVDWDVLVSRVLLPTLLSPLLGFVLAWFGMRALLRAFQAAAPGPARQRFRMAQTVSASAMALGHGLQDGQKTMAVIVLALVAAGEQDIADGVPLWARLSVALALALGTAAGGWRIIVTLGRRMAPVDPASGFAAETVAASLLYTAALAGAPISSTHTVATSIVGAAGARGLRVVRWGAVRRIVLAWVLTPVFTGAVAAGLTAVVH